MIRLLNIFAASTWLVYIFQKAVLISGHWFEAAGAQSQITVVLHSEKAVTFFFDRS